MNLISPPGICIFLYLPITPLTGDTDGTGYFFDYILDDSKIHLIEVKDYTGWKLMNNLLPLKNQKWAYYDDNHQRIESGWHYLKDTYGEDKWYYFENYYKKIGWHEENGHKYFLSNIDDDGNGFLNGNRFENRTETIDGVEYTVDENGICTNCT